MSSENVRNRPNLPYRSNFRAGRGGSKHFRILLKIGIDSLVMKENSWYNVELDQRKSPKNETP